MGANVVECLVCLLFGCYKESEVFSFVLATSSEINGMPLSCFELFCCILSCC